MDNNNDKKGTQPDCVKGPSQRGVLKKKRWNGKKVNG